MAAITAAAANGLGDNTVRVVTKSGDRTIGIDIDDTAIAAGTAFAADRNADGTECANGAGDRIAAITTAAADRLGQNTGRVVAAGFNIAVGIGIDVDRTALAAGTGITTNGDTGEQAAGDGVAAITAAATDRLRDQAAGVCSGRQNITIDVDGHVISVLAIAAGTANRDHAAGTAAITATAADGLGHDTG